MASVKSKITDIDKGFKGIVAELGKTKHSYTQVGVQTDAGLEPESKATVLQVAFDNEFGTDKIPARPFMRQAFQMNKSKLDEIVKSEYSKVLKHKSTVKKSLGLIGEFMQAKIQKRIVDLRTPPNANITILRKKSTNPLIDTGNMRQSVRHIEVIKK